LVLLFILSGRILAQEPEYDEISVFLNVQQIGGADIPAVIEGTNVYLPVAVIFDFLKIKNRVTPDLDSISGFFINPQSTFLIEYKKNKIIYKEKTYEIKPGGFIRTETNLYLKSTYFGEIFELDCSFSFRTLSVSLTTKLELPVIREMRQETMRANISHLKGEEVADTTIKRTYPGFHFGMADWSVIATQLFPGLNDTRVNLSLGAIVAGGETDVTLNYSSSQPFTEKDQYYLWRYANNDHRFMRQAMIGKINAQSTSSIYAPVVGVQITNTPTTYRRSFCTYRLSDRTEPGWIVELYVNNVLVDYVKADASGFFTFEVPLVYGNTAVKLRFYGPWGEEKAREQNISIPFNFLPPKEIEYTASAGFVEDSLTSRYARGNINYGLSRRITIGGGVEYLSSVTSGTTMPFVNMSLRLASSLLLSGEYTYGVRFRGLLSYRLPNNLQFDVTYLNYNKHQTAINYNILEERKAVISMPFVGRRFSSFVRFTADQMILPATQSTTTELLLSTAFGRVNANYTTYALFSELTSPYIYSNLSIAFRLPARFVFTPQAQFQYNPGQFISVKAELEKNIFRNGYANLSVEQNFLSNINNVQIGLRYDFDFAQTGLTFRKGNTSTTMIESARGSMINESKIHYFGVNNRTSVGRGGIVIIPYLDINCNGHHEKGEPRVPGLNIRLNGGRIEVDNKDTTIRVMDLEPYINYYVELDRNSFDNIAWQLTKKSMSIAINPNQYRLVEVPISVVGEVSGMVYMQGTQGKFGQGRIIVCFYDKESRLVARTVSEAEGYFNFLGLAPGNYTARIDTAQLRKLHMVSHPENEPFTIARSKDGDVVDDLEFVLVRETTDSLQGKPVPQKQGVGPGQKMEVQPNPGTQAPTGKENIDQPGPGTKNNKPGEQVQPVVPVKEYEKQNPEKPGSGSGGKVPDTVSTFMIQVGTYRNESNALSVQSALTKISVHPVRIVSGNGLYKVLITDFGDKKEANNFLPELEKKNFPGAIVVPSGR
jgi:hypothetical protein